MKPELHDELAEGFRKLARLQFLLLQRELDEYKLYVGQPRILMILEEKGNLTQKELGNMLETSPAALSVSLRRMEKSELVRRVTDDGDQRLNRITLTDKGRKALEGCRAGWKTANGVMFDGFTAGEMETLRLYFERMGKNLSEYRADTAYITGGKSASADSGASE